MAPDRHQGKSIAVEAAPTEVQPHDVIVGGASAPTSFDLGTETLALEQEHRGQSPSCKVDADNVAHGVPANAAFSQSCIKR